MYVVIASSLICGHNTYIYIFRNTHKVKRKKDEKKFTCKFIMQNYNYYIIDSF